MRKAVIKKVARPHAPPCRHQVGDGQMPHIVVELYAGAARMYLDSLVGATTNCSCRECLRLREAARDALAMMRGEL